MTFTQKNAHRGACILYYRPTYDFCVAFGRDKPFQSRSANAGYSGRVGYPYRERGASGKSLTHVNPFFFTAFRATYRTIRGRLSSTRRLLDRSARFFWFLCPLPRNFRPASVYLPASDPVYFYRNPVDLVAVTEVISSPFLHFSRNWVLSTIRRHRGYFRVERSRNWRRDLSWGRNQLIGKYTGCPVWSYRCICFEKYAALLGLGVEVERRLLKASDVELFILNCSSRCSLTFSRKKY